MTAISSFLVVNAEEVLFDFLSGQTIVRVRVQRSDIDRAQGRALSAGEALDLVRARMTAIGRVLVYGYGSLQPVLKLPLAEIAQDGSTGGAVLLP